MRHRVEIRLGCLFGAEISNARAKVLDEDPAAEGSDANAWQSKEIPPVKIWPTRFHLEQMDMRTQQKHEIILPYTTAPELKEHMERRGLRTIWRAGR